MERIMKNWKLELLLFAAILAMFFGFALGIQ